MARALALTPAQAAQVDRMWRGFMTPQEIARVMGLPVATVKATLRRRPAEVTS